jgi:hypothetical protein
MGLTQKVGVRADQLDATVFPWDSDDGVARSRSIGFGRDLVKVLEDLGLQGHSDAIKPDIADQLLELLQNCETIIYSRSSSRSMTPKLVDDLLVDLGCGPPLILARTPGALEAHVVQRWGCRVSDGVSEEIDGLVDAGRHVRRLRFGCDAQ